MISFRIENKQFRQIIKITQEHNNNRRQNTQYKSKFEDVENILKESGRKTTHDSQQDRWCAEYILNESLNEG